MSRPTFLNVPMHLECNARPTVTFQAAERPLAGTKLYFLLMVSRV